MSKLLGDLKRKEKGFNIKWSILRWLLLYSASQSRCNLCIEEELWLVKSDSKNNQTKDLDLKYSQNASCQFFTGKFLDLRHVEIANQIMPLYPLDHSLQDYSP